MRSLFVLFALMSTITVANAQSDQKEISMYPEAKEGYERVIIYLPTKKNEEHLKVEITAGKHAEVDNCNNHFLMGQFSEQIVDGWGYTYFDFNSNGVMGGTLMGCPDDKKVTKFITAQSHLIRYNSKLPIVVYVPKGMEVKYRIWTADKKGWK